MASDALVRSPTPSIKFSPLENSTHSCIQHVLSRGCRGRPAPLLSNKACSTMKLLIHLINADLLTCGIATIIQVGFVGVKLPSSRASLTAVFLIAIGGYAAPAPRPAWLSSPCTAHHRRWPLAPPGRPLSRQAPALPRRSSRARSRRPALSKPTTFLRWTDDVPEDTRRRSPFNVARYRHLVHPRLFKGFSRPSSAWL